MKPTTDPVKALRQAADEIVARFEKAWTFDIHDLKKPSADEVLRQLIASFESEKRNRLEAEFFGAGPLAALVDDQEVSEIIVNGPDDIWFERTESFTRFADSFLTGLTYKNFIDRVCGEAGIKIDLVHPFADGRWKGFRVHLACEPLTHCSFHMTLRRLPENPWTVAKLVECGWCDRDQARILGESIASKQNMIIIGPTGSGKTSVLAALLRELDPDERVVVIEDCDELPLPNRASTKLLSRPQSSDELPEVTLTDLVKQSLRMRPFRLAIGEVRGPEAKDLLLALATGHGGSLGTLHASDARQALLRLEMLIQLGAPQWNGQTVRQLMHLSIHRLIVCGISNGVRRLQSVHALAGLESVGFLLEQIA